MKNKTKLLLLIAASILFGCNNNDSLNRIEESGTIEIKTITLSSEVNGKVKSLLAKEGLKVFKGDTLIMIDDAKLRIQLSQAEAQVKIAESALELLIEGARKEDVNSALQLLKQAEASFTLANKEAQRSKNLYETKTISKQKFDQVNTQKKVAEAQLITAKENLKKIKNIARPEEIKQAEAQLQMAKAQYDLISKYIEDSYITAPIDAFVMEQYVEQGEMVVPLTSVLKIANINVAELSIYVPETKIGSVKLGQEADINIDTFSDKVFKGIVTYISPDAEFTPKNIQTKDERTKLVFKVKITIENKNHELKSGIPADAVIKL